MATNYVTLSGTIKWANSKFGGLFTPDPKYGTYKAQLYPDNESWEKFKKSGLQIKTYDDPEDGSYILLKRRVEKVIKGKLEKFERPKIFFNNGIEPTKDIGNGSSVKVQVAVFDTMKGKGHTLMEVTVTDLVQYEAGSGGGRQELVDEEENNEVIGAKRQEVAFNDEIPFETDSETSGDELPVQEVKEVVKTPAKRTPFRR